MDTGRYDEKTRQLIERSTELAVSLNGSAPRMLARLKKHASGNNDDALYGYACYYYASYCYDTGDYERFQKDLRLAIRSLLRANDHGLLARAYSFFASDAHSNGYFDIAYSYYNTAMRFMKRDESPAVSGVVNTNLALLYYNLDHHKAADRYFRRGIAMLNRDKSDPMYLRNILVAVCSCGTNAVAMDDPEAAKRYAKKAGDLYHRFKDDLPRGAEMIFRFFQARLSLALKEKGEVIRECRTITRILAEDPYAFAYMDAIGDFCRALLKSNYIKTARMIIDAVSPSVEGCDVNIEKYRLAELKADYHEICRDEASLTESLLEQHRLLLLRQEDLRRTYRYSMELIHMVVELQEEEQLVRSENASLQVIAHTDPLTRIPNRMHMDRELQEAFERSFGGKRHFGVELLDIDDFKTYNDTYGHRTGDNCLTALGKILKNIALDDRVFAARYGGDEFVIIYEGMSDEEILKTAGRIRDAVGGLCVRAGNKTLRHSLRVSQGICNDIPRKKSKPWDFLSEADRALYAVKAADGGGTANNGVMLQKLSDVFG